MHYVRCTVVYHLCVDHWSSQINLVWPKYSVTTALVMVVVGTKVKLRFTLFVRSFHHLVNISKPYAAAFVSECQLGNTVLF